jgi:hypothetical protein
MHPPNGENAPPGKEGASSKVDLQGSKIEKENRSSPRSGQARRVAKRVGDHAIVRYLERTDRIDREALAREILSPRVVAAMDKAPQGKSVYYDPWGTFAYVIAKSGNVAHRHHGPLPRLPR